MMAEVEEESVIGGSIQSGSIQSGSVVSGSVDSDESDEEYGEENGGAGSESAEGESEGESVDVVTEDAPGACPPYKRRCGTPGCFLPEYHGGPCMRDQAPPRHAPSVPEARPRAHAWADWIPAARRCLQGCVRRRRRRRASTPASATDIARSRAPVAARGAPGGRARTSVLAPNIDGLRCVKIYYRKV